MAELPPKLVIGPEQWSYMSSLERDMWVEELARGGVRAPDSVREVTVEQVAEGKVRATVVGYCEGPSLGDRGTLVRGIHLRGWCRGPGREVARRIAVIGPSNFSTYYPSTYSPASTYSLEPEIHNTYIPTDHHAVCVLIINVFYLSNADRVFSLFPPQPLWSPDPVVGWRTWGFAWRDGRIVLRGVIRPWEAGQVNVAFHLADGQEQHSAPGWNCRCGFNAFKTLRSLVRYGSYDMDVAGRVELFGNVVEHERGYRAEKARILDLVFPRRVSKYNQLVHDFFTGMNAHNIPTFNNWSDYLDYLSTQSNAAHDDLVHLPRAEIANLAFSFLAPRRGWARGLTAIR